MTLIVKGGVPAEVSRRDIYGSGDFVAMGAEQIPPPVCVVIAQALCVLPLEGDDVRPDVA